MNKKIYIVHQWYGGVEKDWISYVRNKLISLGYEVIAFDMPSPEKPIIETWVNFLKENINDINENTYFIGHSIGCQTIIRYLEKQDKKIGGAFFVAGWFELTNLETKEQELVAKPWIETPINFDNIKNVLPWSIAMLSDNDKWVPYEINKERFEKNLNSEIATIHNAGHVTEDDGFVELPQLIDIIENKLNKIGIIFNKFIKEINDPLHSTLSTTDKNGDPYGAPVYFAYDNNACIYWTSSKDSQHSKNIKENGKVYITIFKEGLSEGTGERCGIYLKGDAVELNNIDDIKYAREKTANRKGSISEHPERFIGDSPRKVYRFTPVKIWTNDALNITGPDKLLHPCDVRVEL